MLLVLDVQEKLISNIKNKEVIVPSLTFVSTVNAIKLNGGIPIFCDVNLETGCISVDDIKKRITKKTVAVLPVHFAGLPCEIKSIQQICKNHIPQPMKVIVFAVQYLRKFR